MGKEISLFSGYKQDENRTTNYCQLVLRMLYEEHPKLLAEALSTLCDGATLPVGVQFRQQEGKGDAVPDGIIQQAGFTVYIETKHHDKFNIDQLKRHMLALQKQSGTKVMLALGRFEGQPKAQFEAFQQQWAAEHGNTILFAAASFETFIMAVRSASLSLALANIVSDFEQYLDQMGLLPSWRKRLDVVNCGEFHSLQVKARAYVCPSQGGAYSHQRCAFLGMYWQKAANKVASIWGVVDVDPREDGTAEVLWNNEAANGLTNEALIKEARDRFYQSWPDRDWVGRVFVLGPLFDTRFEKDSPGGMFGNKRYFWLGGYKALNTNDAEVLAQELRKFKWTDWN